MTLMYDLQEDPVLKKLYSWIENVPDFYEVQELQNKRKLVYQSILSLRRSIEAKERTVIINSDAPRSNAARKQKLIDTQEDHETLLQLEQELAGLDIDLDLINKRISMFQSASFVFTQRSKLAIKG
jgi:hypothetical protein